MFADGRGVRVNRRLAGQHIVRWATLLAALLLMAASPLAAQLPPAASQGAGQGGPAPAGRQSDVCESSAAGSPYIPVDSWVYPAVLRLYSLGFVDSVYLGMRPWTRSSVNNMLDEVGSRIEDYDAGPATNEAERIYTGTDPRVALQCSGLLPGPGGSCAGGVGLLGGARHQRHAAPRQLSSRLDRHQRLRPSLPERLQ